jgi:Asp-tRNA(Asn)/Glu-tRNA(Gln) amidotransferase B subunit
MAANWVINELFGRLNKEGSDIADSPISAEQLGAIIDMIGQHHLRQDRQGRVRDRLDRRRRPEADR